MTIFFNVEMRWQDFLRFINDLYFISREKVTGRKLEMRSHRRSKSWRTTRHACFRSHCVGGPIAEPTLGETQSIRRGHSTILYCCLISLPSSARVRKIVFRNPERDREYAKWRACARSTRVSSIMDRITCADAVIATLWRRERMKKKQRKRERERERERDRGSLVKLKSTPRKSRIQGGEINSWCAVCWIKSKLSVALKFFVARGRPADNYDLYLHISRDRCRYRYFSILIRAAHCRAVWEARRNL